MRSRDVSHPLAVVFLAISLSACSYSASHAQGIQPGWCVPDGVIYSQALAGNTLFIGGAFSRLGAPTGGGIVVDPVAGALVPDFPKVAGTIYATTSDGAGGWYIGGVFDHVGGLPRANIAHVKADLTVDSWNPGTNGEVRAIAVTGSIVYAGGAFTSIGGVNRKCIAAIDATSGAVTSWDAGVNDNSLTVQAIAADGARVFVSGIFTFIGGQPRSYLAALDPTTGLALPWNPSPNYQAYAFALKGNRLIVGGSFDHIGGIAMSGIAEVDATTGAVNAAWDARSDGEVRALAWVGSTIYVGGSFTSIGGQSRAHLAAYDETTRHVTGFNPGANGAVLALAPMSGALFVGGTFSAIGATPRSNCAAIDMTTGAVGTWDPSPNKLVFALATGAGSVYVGGALTSAGGVARRGLAAIDVTTGQPTEWDAGCDGAVYRVAVSGDVVYAGGSFTHLGGQTRNGLAALDAYSGVASSWNPAAASGSYGISALVPDGNVVYVGGEFTSMGGASRTGVAAIDATTGLATAWNPGVTGGVTAIAIDGEKIYLGGFLFFVVGGQQRSYLAAVDKVLGAATPWAPVARPSYLTDVVFINALLCDGGRVLVGGHFGSLNNLGRNCLAAVDTSSGATLAFSPQPDYEVNSLMRWNSVLFVGGMFGGIAGQVRPRLAALDLASGAALAWNPAADGAIWSIVPAAQAVYVAGDFGHIGGTLQSDVAAVGQVPGQIVAVVAPAVSTSLQASMANPARGIAVTLSLPSDQPVSLDVYDVSGRRVLTRSEKFGAGRRTLELARPGQLSPGVYLVRVAQGSASVVGKAVVVR